MGGDLQSQAAKRLAIWQWLLLGVVVVGALALRLHDLSRIFLWMDEVDLFNVKLYGNPPQPLLDYALSSRDATTGTWGWPMTIWLACRAFGATLVVSRLPAVFVGTAAVGMIFLLVYHLIPQLPPSSRFIPAICAAVLAAISIPLMEFSQRTYAYGADPLMAAFVLVAHIALWRAVSPANEDKRRLLRALAVYAIAVSLAASTHPSLVPIIATSLLFTAAHCFLTLPRLNQQQRSRLLRGGTATLVLIGTVVLLNRKNPKYGFRPYLSGYYHSVSLHSIPRLVMHAYDVATYLLNLAYNTSIYFPERLNIVLLPLVALCVCGWILSLRGKYGDAAKHLALLGAVTLATPAALSFINVFPFGGIRQTLFLSPLFIAFTALGFYALLANRTTQAAAGLVAVSYLTLWAFNLPRFYEDRRMLYSSEDLVHLWRENDRGIYYCQICGPELEYMLRSDAEIAVKQLPANAKPPYLLVSTRWPVGDNPYFHDFVNSLNKTGYHATPLLIKAARHPESWEHSGTLYFPPHGLFVYRVTE